MGGIKVVAYSGSLEIHLIRGGGKITCLTPTDVICGGEQLNSSDALCVISKTSKSELVQALKQFVHSQLEQYTNLLVQPVQPVFMAEGGPPLTDGRFLRPQGSWNNLGGENEHKLTVAEMPSHRHRSTDAGKTGNIGSGAGYTVPVVNNYGGDTAYTSWEGYNAAHNNIPAYRTCYCWYRTS